MALFFKSAIAEVLKEGKKPLSISEITKRIFEKKLVKSKGKTPADTISARLNEDVRRNGRNSQFIKIKTGVFKLNPNFKEEIKTNKTTKEKESDIEREGTIVLLGQKINVKGNKLVRL